jgi:phosphoglycerate dehydrogenase-like enzyme
VSIVNPFRLLVLDDREGALSSAASMARIRERAEVTVLRDPMAGQHETLLANAHALLALRERTLIDASFLSRCQQLELLLQTGGHAYHVDLDAATARGVVVALGRRVTTPTRVLPELVFALLLALVRRLPEQAGSMRDGRWTPVLGGSLHGRTLGILGYGRIGRPVARLAKAFGMHVVAWNRSEQRGHDEAEGVALVPLDELLANSDVLTIHLRLAEQTRGLVDEAFLERMKPGAVLINTARGAIIREAALVAALGSGHVGGAGLDVFATEPLPEASPLRTLPNVVLTPHVGWLVGDVLREFVDVAHVQLEAWLDYRLTTTEVLNPQAMAHPRKRHGGLQARPEE